MNGRHDIIGPGSGHEMHCPLCGYQGNSYFHIICSGGHCQLCGKPGSRSQCEQCSAVVCDEHLERHQLYGISLCSKCKAQVDGVPFRKSKKKWDYSDCHCYACEMTRRWSDPEMDKAISRMKKMKKLPSEY